MVRAQLDKVPEDVAAMFDSVAKRYDLLNGVLSLGLERRWRAQVEKAVGARSGERVLDLAAGTGTSSRAFTRRGADCAACDFSLGMLEVGMRRQRKAGQAARVGRAGRLRFVAGDALRLPFGDDVADAVTISFGLRNVADPAAALAEMRRVTRPGGRLVICEFGHLPGRPLDRVYDWALAVALPAVAGALSANAAAYSYLAKSIKDWPDGRRLADLVRAAGWRSVRWRGLAMGIVAVHTAVNPAAADRQHCGS